MLTFEMIRELERQERDNKKLQKLPDNLIDELRDYIKRKEKIVQKSTGDILELENVKKTIKSFFEIRERKLMTMVLSMVQSGLPAENLSSEERQIFYAIVDHIKRHREKFFSDINRDEASVQPEKSVQKSERIIYKVKKDLKEFVGPDMRNYRLVRGEIVNLPKPLNDLLLKEGIIEQIRE